MNLKEYHNQAINWFKTNFNYFISDDDNYCEGVQGDFHLIYCVDDKPLTVYSNSNGLFSGIYGFEYNEFELLNLIL
jgi:hypothetical protein